MVEALKKFCKPLFNTMLSRYNFRFNFDLQCRHNTNVLRLQHRGSRSGNIYWNHSKTSNGWTKFFALSIIFEQINISSSVILVYYRITWTRIQYNFATIFFFFFYFLFILLLNDVITHAYDADENNLENIRERRRRR